MKKARLLIIFLAVFLDYSFALAESRGEIDSLLLCVDKSSGAEKIDLLLQLGELTISKDPGKSFEYISDAIALSKEMDNKVKGAVSFALLGKMYQTQGKYQKAINTYTIVQSMYEALADNKGLGNTYNSIGIVYYYMSQYDKALESYQQSLKIFEKISDFEDMVKSLNNIGVVYDEIQNYTKALEYYNAALALNKKLNDKRGIAISLNNIGNCYYYNKDIDTALNYFNKSIELKKEVGDFKGMANTYFNLARICIANEEYTKALIYYDKCQEIEESKGFTEGLSKTFLYIGHTYNKLENTKEALRYFNKSLKIADSLNLVAVQRDCFAALSEVYYNTGKFEKAFEYYRAYTKIKEQIYSEEQHNQMAEIEMKYQVEKKEQEIELFESEIKRQRLLITIASAGILILMVFLFIVIRQFRQKKKINQQLEKYNKEIEAQKMDITASIEYAQRIQAAILPEKEHINALLPENFIIYLPKDIVSGDFYWAEDKNGIVYIAVVDCTGHGVPGAFMSLIGNTLLNEILVEKKIYNPAEMLNELNHLVKLSLKQDHTKYDNLDGMDIALCAIDTKNMKLSFAGANRDLYLFRNNELSIIESNHTAIAGITEDGYQFKNQEIEIFKEDVIYLSSDGYSDQFGGENGKKFMIKNFRKTLLQVHKLPMNEQKEQLLRILEEWKGQHQQVDDILVVGIRF